MKTKKKYAGPERRDFLRIKFTKPLAYKVCKKVTVSNLLQGYTHDISRSGILCSVKEKIRVNDIVWLSFDSSTLEIFKDLEKSVLIYQGGMIGKVVRIKREHDGTYSAGLKFVTREEKNLTHIYPKIHFLSKK